MSEEERTRRGHGETVMMRTAEEVAAAHAGSAPSARPLEPGPFRAAVMRGLWLGVLLGAVAGAVWAWLLLSHTVVIGGWEQLYSVGEFTFYVLWVLIGAALGIATVGVAGLLLATPTRPPEAAAKEGGAAGE